MSDQPQRLVIVDDDPELLQFLMEELKGAGYDCVGVDNGQEALLHLRQNTVDLALLDWSLPDLSGVEICARLRRTDDRTPVLMLTARDGIEERVHALDTGVDDYLVKPFDVKELHARVRACLRRSALTAPAGGEILNLGDLELNVIERTVQRGARGIELSQREFDLLRHLLQHSGTVLERGEILNAVWGEPFIGDPNTLDVYMGY
uniref:response regulator transcription factor n=1 Tax=Parasynechococcus sp. TaxID=3101203 RepID=UPI0037048FB2